MDAAVPKRLAAAPLPQRPRLDLIPTPREQNPFAPDSGNLMHFTLPARQASLPRSTIYEGALAEICSAPQKAGACNRRD